MSDGCLILDQRLHDKVRSYPPNGYRDKYIVFKRLTSFPVLLIISFYERQAKLIGTITFYETVAHVIDKLFDKLPRALKKMSMYKFSFFVLLDLIFI